MSEEKTGLGTQFLRYDSVQTKYIKTVSVASIGPPQPVREVVDVDDLDPEDQIKKKLLGLIDMGEMKLTVNYDPGEETHLALEDDLADGVENEYRIQFPPASSSFVHGGYFNISAYVTSFAPQDITSNGVMQAEITLTVLARPEYGQPE